MRKILPLIAFSFPLILGAALFATPTAQSGSPNYTLVRKIPIPGDDGWDYTAVDSAARRVYVSHGTHVVVLDADSYSIAGDIPNTPGVHGIAIASSLNRGFTSNGRVNNVTIFDLKSLAKIGEVSTGENPDAIVYDDVTKRVFTMNGRSNNSTAIDAATGKVLGTIALVGRPEFAAADTGAVFVNIEDKSEISRIDARTLQVTNTWPLAPCDSPSGLAMDTAHRRLFSGCHNKMMAVVDADTGKVIATPDIGEGVDANAFDPSTQFAFASCGDGTVTVVHEDSPSKFSVVQTASTQKSARTMGLDLHSHSLFLPAASLLPLQPAQTRPSPQPGTFVVLVLAAK
jgi:DNA-binding beta-propeller fold protein YncE